MENHAICIPLPAQGHIRPMLKLAQILNSKFGFHITFINTHHNHQTLFQKSSTLNNENFPTFKFESLPELGPNDPTDATAVLNSVLNGQMGPPLKEVLLRLCDKDYCSANNLRPVTCMVCDEAFSIFTLDVAEEIGISSVVLETASACGFMGYLQHRQLLDKGIIPLQDSSCLTNGYLEKAIDWIPSLKGICLKDMPTSIRTTDPNDKLMNHVMLSVHRALKSQAIIFNTFDALEQDVLKDLSTLSSNIYPIGPLHLLMDQVSDNDNNGPIGLAHLCKEDVDYIQWLDSQEPNSVLYVNFGTIAVVTQEQLVELAWGLANSQVKFFWVVRSDLVSGGSNSLPFEFEKEIKTRGLLARWCDQERVLVHPSIGWFLTHSGWNSMIESVSSGVPMICWSFMAEQTTNSWYCCNRLGIGVKISKEMSRYEVEKVVKELMEGEKGKEIKRKATEWRELAKKAVMSSPGSSYVNLENVVNNVLCASTSIK